MLGGNIFDLLNDLLFTKHRDRLTKFLKNDNFASEKRDGGIVNCTEISSNKFIAIPEEITHLCLSILSTVQKILITIQLYQRGRCLLLMKVLLNSLKIKYLKKMLQELDFQILDQQQPSRSAQCSYLQVSEISKLFLQLQEARFIPLNKVQSSTSKPELSGHPQYLVNFSSGLKLGSLINSMNIKFFSDKKNTNRICCQVVYLNMHQENYFRHQIVQEAREQSINIDRFQIIIQVQWQVTFI